MVILSSPGIGGSGRQGMARLGGDWSPTAVASPLQCTSAMAVGLCGRGETSWRGTSTCMSFCSAACCSNPSRWHPPCPPEKKDAPIIIPHVNHWPGMTFVYRDGCQGNFGYCLLGEVRLRGWKSKVSSSSARYFSFSFLLFFTFVFSFFSPCHCIPYCIIFFFISFLPPPSVFFSSLRFVSACLLFYHVIFSPLPLSHQCTMNT